MDSINRLQATQVVDPLHAHNLIWCGAVVCSSPLKTALLPPYERRRKGVSRRARGLFIVALVGGVNLHRQRASCTMNPVLCRRRGLWRQTAGVMVEVVVAVIPCSSRFRNRNGKPQRTGLRGFRNRILDDDKLPQLPRLAV